MNTQASKIKILIVEDEAILALDISNRLSDRNYEIAGVAPTVNRAIQLIEENDIIDLILIDITLGGDQDGIELAQIINERYGIPFIFLTAHADEHLVQRAKNVAPYAYILKPFNEQQVNIAIGLALDKFSKKTREKNLLQHRKFNPEENEGLQFKDSLYLKKELLKVSLETEERERKRISHHLHDDLISQLYRIKLMCKDASLNELIKHGIKTARIVSHELTPPMLNELSIEELIIDFLYPYNEQYSISFYYNPKRIGHLNNTFKLHIFRIFQQLIINIEKHAKATKIEIILRLSSTYISLSVQDNGIGYNAKSKLGIGLKSIESRVQVLNGSHRIKKVRKGTLFTFIAKK